MPKKTSATVGKTKGRSKRETDDNALCELDNSKKSNRTNRQCSQTRSQERETTNRNRVVIEAQVHRNSRESPDTDNVKNTEKMSEESQENELADEHTNQTPADQAETTNVSFREGEDMVDMEVPDRDEFQEEEDMETDSSTQSSEEGGNSVSEEEQDGEVSFNSNTNHRSHTQVRSGNKRRSQRKRNDHFEDSDDSDEDMDPAEMKSMKKFAKFLEKSGFLSKNQGGGDRESPKREDDPPRKRAKLANINSKRKTGKGMNINSLAASSETTIYDRAVPMIMANGIDDPQNGVLVRKRDSSSSEDVINTSDESHNSPPIVFNNTDQINAIQQFLDFQRAELRRKNTWEEDEEQPQPSTSRGGPNRREQPSKSKDRIKQAEEAKARLYQVPGKQPMISPVSDSSQVGKIFKDRELLLSVLVDEGYTAVSNHVDEVTKRKIILGQYVDFSKLLPRDQIKSERDSQRMEMINVDGVPVWQPVADRDLPVINSFSKWDQAFRVFSAIFTEVYPTRAKELVQYSHNIHLASISYIWDNVYAYDIDFRIHMSKYPERNWGIILSVSWQTRLKEKITSLKTVVGSANPVNGSGCDGNSNSNSRTKKNCWKYNRGKCSYGFSCKFEHHCGICNRYGHGAHNCRKGKNGAESQENTTYQDRREKRK